MLFGVILIVTVGILLVIVTILGFQVHHQSQRITSNERKMEDILCTINIYAGMARQISENDSKINTVVDMLIRNAKTESVLKGLATINSPLVASDDARQYFASMKDELRSYYLTIGIHLSENDLFLDVQNRFGDRIFKEICLPLKIMNNACITLAIAIAREQD